MQRSVRCILALWLLAVAAGCRSEDPAGSSQADPSLTDMAIPLRTAQAEYTIRRTRSGLEAEIAFAYTNPTRAPVYVPGCRGPAPPLLQKREGDRWVDAYAPTVLLCYTEPAPIRPGQTVHDTLYIRAGLPKSNVYPQFGVADVPGTYRLVWFVHRTPEPVRSRDGLLPLEQRVSNEFRLAVE